MEDSQRNHVAIIGAGISGLTCAHLLASRGVEVTIFDKGRGVGGRMSTRRSSSGMRFDHGAQYFTVRDYRFRKYVDSWLGSGVVASWQGKIGTLRAGEVQLKTSETPRFVGVPGMTAICKHLGEGLNIALETLVAPPERIDNGWQLKDQHGYDLGIYDTVVVSAPAPQAASLLAAAEQLQRRALKVTMSGCWSVMLAFKQPLELPVDGAFVQDSPLSWIARNSSKPSRDPAADTWILHASPEWSQKTLEYGKQEALKSLQSSFWQATGLEPQDPVHAETHRWKYAVPTEPLAERCLFDSSLRIGACGDWCAGPRVEGAFLSGMDLARLIAG